jgi:hypothetical protein
MEILIPFDTRASRAARLRQLLTSAYHAQLPENDETRVQWLGEKWTSAYHAQLPENDETRVQWLGEKWSRKKFSLWP